MATKLDAGVPFPEFSLQVVDGRALALPSGLGTKYTVVLFYRGHW